ncbi:MAG: FKBP-type peptidyl-prolyl cis-trans isomerase [Candidatus Wildermuthbacteria bacterium]|nr:FKBP-type peptidyl-prolyl cis-trans isomerase [Candidatus Wildermuthbacteria bacterium]
MKSYLIGFILAIGVVGLFYVLVMKQNLQQDETGNTGQNQQTNKEIVMPSGLKIEDVKIGAGAEAKEENTVVVHYTGTFLNGTKFDSSFDRGEPFPFVLGAGQVIQGWEQGILGMKVGGKRKLTIPPALAYGERGAGNVIPPNATLLFEVELLEVK